MKYYAIILYWNSKAIFNPVVLLYFVNLIRLLLILLFYVVQMDVRNRQEEISYLRASMTRLRDELDQQRRLNVCLKERKVRLLKLMVGLQLKRIRMKWFHIQGIEFKTSTRNFQCKDPTLWKSISLRGREFQPPLKSTFIVVAQVIIP